MTYSDSNPNDQCLYLKAGQRQALKEDLRELESLLIIFSENQQVPNVRKTKRQITRIRIMLLADEGKSQTEISQELKCSQATARHWISVAKSGDMKQWQENVAGPHYKLTDEHIKYLKYLVVCSPREFGYSFDKWTGGYLSKELNQKFDIAVNKHLVNRYLTKIINFQIKNLK